MNIVRMDRAFFTSGHVGSPVGTVGRDPSRQDVDGMTPSSCDVMLVFLTGMHRMSPPTGHADRSTGRRALWLSVTCRVTRTADEDLSSSTSPMPASVPSSWPCTWACLHCATLEHACTAPRWKSTCWWASGYGPTTPVICLPAKSVSGTTPTGLHSCGRYVRRRRMACGGVGVGSAEAERAAGGRARGPVDEARSHCRAYPTTPSLELSDKCGRMPSQYRPKVPSSGTDRRGEGREELNGRDRVLPLVA